MERRTYRGPITARGLAGALVTRFDVGHLIARASGEDDHTIVQIASREMDRMGQVRAALTINIVQQADVVEVSLGEHQWLGPAADILQAGALAVFSPFTLLAHASSIADDVQTLQLPTQVWEAVDHYVESVGAQLGLAEQERMVACPYCGVGNPVGVGQCSACAGSLAGVQPQACPQCGKLSPASATFCARCGTKLDAA
jgi:Double zinc ribbon